MADKRKLSELFPLDEPPRLRDIFPTLREPDLRVTFPSLGGGGFASGGGGYLNTLTIPIVPPQYVPPVPSFTVDYFEFNELYSRWDTQTANNNVSPGPDVVSIGLGENIVFTNTTNDTTYNRLLWTIRHVETNTILPTSDTQTYTIVPNPSESVCTYEVTLQAFNFSAVGTAFVRYINFKRPTPAITFNGITTTFTNFPDPEPYESISETTTLTFVNSTVPLPSWDTSIMTLTLS